MSKNIEDVLIVGAGPTGLTLACTLASRGIKSLIIDKRNTASLIPRSININGPTLEIFNKLGIDNNFAKDGMKLSELIVYWNKMKLLNINYKYTKTLHPYYFHLEQSMVEMYLNKLLESHELKVERNVELIDLFQEENCVTALLKNNKGDLEKHVYRYVAGCDGGNSAVRNLMKISCNQEILPGYFILMDLIADHKLTKKQLNYYLSSDGYLIIAPLPKNKFRMIASIKDIYPGKDHINLSTNSFQKIIDERGPGDIKIKELLWATSAQFYHMLAERAQSGRVFLAGDALHLFSPIGGTNMNIGIQDAYSLGEKISSVLTDNNEHNYLKSYDTERLKIANKVLHATSLATNLLTGGECAEADYKKYLPKFENREFIKSVLPKQFSGIDFI